ncbi:MAG: filamin/ABP280 repeat domain-containing protein, partial [Anaerolineales bacterium]
KSWVSWEQFARFWAQAVRYTISEGAQSATDVRVSRAGEQATISVDAKTDAGAFLTGLAMQANVIGPDGVTQAITLTQSAPGRYTGNFNPTREGAYLIRVAGGDEGSEASIAQTAGWVLSYSPEYQIALPTENESNSVPPNVRFLLQLAQSTGGGNVTGEYAQVFAHDLPPPPSAAQPVWPWLLLAATLLLPFDIGVRRVVITRSDVRRAWARVLSFFAIRAPQPMPVSQQRAEQLSTLFKAKERAGDAAPRNANMPPPIVTSALVETDSNSATKPPAAVVAESKPATPTQKPAAPVGAESKPATAASTTSALLAKKKAREKK